MSGTWLRPDQYAVPEPDVSALTVDDVKRDAMLAIGALMVLRKQVAGRATCSRCGESFLLAQGSEIRLSDFPWPRDKDGVETAECRAPEAHEAEERPWYCEDCAQDKDEEDD